MLVVSLVAVVFVALVIGSRMQLPRGANRADLGWMSADWLAAHRASHPL